MSKPNPFAGEVDALSGADFALLQQAVETRKCREEIGVGNYDAAARKWRPLPPCPDCGADGCVKAGTTPAGHQRWLCGECGRRFAYLLNHVSTIPIPLYDAPDGKQAAHTWSGLAVELGERR